MKRRDFLQNMINSHFSPMFVWDALDFCSGLVYFFEYKLFVALTNKWELNCFQCDLFGLSVLFTLVSLVNMYIFLFVMLYNALLYV